MIGPAAPIDPVAGDRGVLEPAAETRADPERVAGAGDRYRRAVDVEKSLVPQGQSERVEQNVDGPVGTISAPDITTEGGTTQQVTVTYTDTDDIKVDTIGIGDVDVRAPGGGTALQVTGVTIAPQTGNSIVATYTVTCAISKR